ncbi:hypothetical protein B0H14DRAFT_3643273 [Mycena olivaceomarginata]|nr:hypothetical protein B0H14DRAFT_3643273 [Mycena olivaceomarginata]
MSSTFRYPHLLTYYRIPARPVPAAVAIVPSPPPYPLLPLIVPPPARYFTWSLRYPHPCLDPPPRRSFRTVAAVATAIVAVVIACVPAHRPSRPHCVPPHSRNTFLRTFSLSSPRPTLTYNLVDSLICKMHLEDGNSWVYTNKEHGMSATASRGLNLLWDTDLGLSHVDKYTYSSEEYIKAGVLGATGILNSGVRTEVDVAKGLIDKDVDNKSVPLKTSAIMDLGLAYAGSHREYLLQHLIPRVSDTSMGSTSLVTLAKVERSDTGLDEKWARYMVLGLRLLYLALQDASDTPIEHPISKTAQIVEACAFASTGNVLKVQAMLHHCDEHICHYNNFCNLW